MSTRKERRLIAGVLSMLAAGAWLYPATAGAADAPQTANAEPQVTGEAQTANAGTQYYTTEPITVEAKRPDWEATLSPGTVTVIRPEEFQGEQKTLPDFLKMVPGVHVREVNGKGQYTTVTVRGSTAAQVGVFVDGVLTNLGGDAAVDISTIPVSNVERIEVYRGYIPARFGGTFSGGVINVVTKKPMGAHGSAEIGPGSFGGRKASVEITAPVGAGSLLFGFNHEQRDGDFPYHSYAADQWLDHTRTGALYKNLQQQISTLEAMTPAQQAAYNAVPGNNWATDLSDLKNSLAPYEDAAAAAKDAQRHRKYNDYKNTDMLVKWQNDDWMAKATYKHIDRHLPDSLWASSGYAQMIDPGLVVDTKDIYKYDSRRQKIDASSLLLQRRYLTKRMEWGWSIDYLNQKKKYRAEHLYAGWQKKWEHVPLREWSEYRSNKYNVQLDGTYEIDKRNMLDFQMNYSRERMKVSGNGLDERIDQAVITEDSLYAQMRTKYDQDIFNIQLQDTITLDAERTWQLTPAIRYNRSKITGYSDASRFDANKNYQWIHPQDSQTDGKVTWQLALKKEFTPHFSMRMTGGTYYRLLNMYEIAGDGAGILPSPSDRNAQNAVFPRPEEGKQFDLSAIWDGKVLDADNRTTLTFFWRDSDRMLQLYRRGLTYSSYFNDGRGKAHGLELQTNFHWKKFDLDLEGTYLKSSAERRNSATQYSWSEVHPTFQPEWEFNARLAYRPVTQWQLFGELHYISKYYTHFMIDPRNPELSGRPTAALTTLNLGARWSPRKDMALTVGVNDIFDRGPKQRVHSLQGYGDTGTGANIEYPLQGRTYYMNFRYEF